MQLTKTSRFALFIVAAFLILLAGGAYVIVHTVAFNRYVLGKIIQEVEIKSGGRAEVKSMKIHWNKLGIDFYGVNLYGNTGKRSNPFLHVEHLGIGLKNISIFKRTIDLKEIILDQPVFDVHVDANGDSNLPQSISTNTASLSPDALIDLAVQHTSINAGQIYYQNERLPLSADLRKLHVRINFGTFTRAYNGAISYEPGTMVFGKFGLVRHGAELEFTADRSGLVIDHLNLTSGDTRITAHAKLTNFANPSIQGDYNGVVFTQDVATMLEAGSLPATGQISTMGTFRYQNLSGQPFLSCIYLSGVLNSPQLALHIRRTIAVSRSVGGRYELRDGNLQLSELKAELLGGRLLANVEIQNLAGRSTSNMRANLNGISLRQVDDILPSRNHERPHIVGSVNSNIQARWLGDFQDVVVHTHTIINAPRSSAGVRIEANGSVPLNGVLDLQYDDARSTLAFGESHLQIGSTKITVIGTASKQSSLDIQASTTDLHETIALAYAARDAITVSTTDTTATPIDLHGSAQFGGRVIGTVKEPHLKGVLTAVNLAAHGSSWRILRGNVELAPSVISIQDGYLEDLRQGQLTFTARVNLDHWSFTPASPVAIETTATGLSIADLLNAAGLQYPVIGVLSSKFSVHGSEENPFGYGSIQLTNASAWDEPITRLTMDFQGAGETITSTVQLRAPAGAASGKISYSLASGQYDASLNLSALKLDQIRAIQTRHLGITGTMNATAIGRGTLSDPEGNASLQIAQLQVHGQDISQAEATLAIVQRHAQFSGSAVVAQGNLEAKGDVALFGNYATSASFDVRALPIGPLLASYTSLAQPKLQGQAEIHGTFEGPLRQPDRIEAHLEIPTLNLAYGPTEIALVRPLHADYRNGTSTIGETEFKGNGTDITLSGVIPIKNPSAFNINANGTLDLAVLQGFASGVKSSGRLDINIAAQGNLAQPKMQGQVRLLNAAFSTNTTPIGFERINGELAISGNRVDIQKLEGAAGGGIVSAQGVLLYGSQPSFNIELHAKSIRVRYPQGIRAVLDGNIGLVGTSQSSEISGQVLVNRLSFTEGFDLAEFLGQFSSSSSESISSPFEQKARLNVSLRTSQDIYLTSSKLSIQGAADLNLIGTIATPVVLGRATIASGEIFFMGKRYEIQNGALEFANSARTNPVVNIYAKTTVQQYDITTNFIGPVDRLRTTFTSDPSLPPADIINLIAFGKTAEEVASSPSQTPVLGAESMLAQGVSSQVSGRIEKLAGLSQFSISPTLGNSQQNPGAQVAVQQHISGNILLTFSGDVTNTQRQSVQVQYKTSRQTAVSVLRDQNGGYAIDVRYHKQF